LRKDRNFNGNGNGNCNIKNQGQFQKSISIAKMKMKICESVAKEIASPVLLAMTEKLCGFASSW
jgi:hypothetical protein